MQNCRIGGVMISPSAPTLNEFVAKRPKLQSMEALKVVLLYQEHLIDNYQEIAADQPNLDIWEL